MPKSSREAKAVVVASRQAERFPAEVLARTNWNRGLPVNVMIEDVSVLGIRLRASMIAEPGTTLRIGLPNGVAPHARVIWCKGGRIGCEFLEPLDEADLTAILAKLDG